jgi:methylmalonyl-CoA mutase N-terminal domain/subunit
MQSQIYHTILCIIKTMNLEIESRNQLLVLKNESYFDKVNNPADGSYYIETLTAQLAEKRWFYSKISKLMVVF